MTTIIGIDPGISSGGIALIQGLHIDAIKMPETPKDIYYYFRTISAYHTNRFAFLEKVGPMPKQGISSTAKFMKHVGHLEMALLACQIPFEQVSPAKWQRNMGCLSKGDKNVTKRKAQELFPGLKIIHAIADALLIAEYGRRQRGIKIQEL